MGEEALVEASCMMKEEMLSQLLVSVQPVLCINAVQDFKSRTFSIFLNASSTCILMTSLKRILYNICLFLRLRRTFTYSMLL